VVSDALSYTTLEPIYYMRLQKHEFCDMDPIVKLVFEEMAKLCLEIKEGFVLQEATFTKSLNKVDAEEHLCDARMTNLDEAVVVFDKMSGCGLLHRLCQARVIQTEHLLLLRHQGAELLPTWHTYWVSCHTLNCRRQRRWPC
jgi:hypothetical protein